MNQPAITQMLAGTMSYMTQRQGLLAQNMAHIDVPGYQAQDLQKIDFNAMVEHSGPAMKLSRPSDGKFMTGTAGSGDSRYVAGKTRKSYDVTPNGNTVVLEEQMAKISDTNAQFQMASNLYKKFNSLYAAAIGKPNS